MRTFRLPRSSSRRRWIAVLAASAACFGIGVAFAPGASARPVNPSDSSINKAKAAKARAAKDVGRLTGQIAGIETKLRQLDAAAELAQQKYDKALFDLQLAKKAAARTAKKVVTAQDNLSTAQATFQQYLRSLYVSSAADGSGLLTAPDPNALLVRNDLTHYASTHQIDGLGTLRRATVAKSNADAAARVAVINQRTAANKAKIAYRGAVNAVNAAQQQKSALTAQKAQFEEQLQAAGMQLTGLQNKRAAYQKWHAQQVAAARALAAREAARLRAALHHGQSSGGNPNPSGSAAPRGNWTPARGRAAVGYAEHYLGWPYAWDGGSYSGPTVGACIDAVTTYYGDCHKVGFDCSGLTMYAWAQLGVYTSHYAPTQWYMGRFHPQPYELMPGDLILYSFYGTPGTAHHITMYIGNGMMIEAPQSGEFVHLSPLRLGEWAGAVRPGS